MRQEIGLATRVVLSSIALVFGVTVSGAQPDALHAGQGATDTAALEAWVDGHLQQARARIDELASERSGCAALPAHRARAGRLHAWQRSGEEVSRPRARLRRV